MGHTLSLRGPILFFMKTHQMITLGPECQSFDFTWPTVWETISFEHPRHGLFRDDPKFEVKAHRSLEAIRDDVLTEAPAVVVLGPHTRSAPRLDEVLKRLGAPHRPFHAVAFLPFPFNVPDPAYEASLQGAAFLAQSLTLLDGRRLMHHFSPRTTVYQAFAVVDEMMRLLLEDHHLLLLQPSHSRVRKAFTGIFRWEGTRPGRFPGLESLIPLRRLCGEPLASGSILLTETSDKGRRERALRRLGWSNHSCVVRAPREQGRSPSDRSSAFVPMPLLLNAHASGI
jgi:hypothetical protein